MLMYIIVLKLGEMFLSLVMKELQQLSGQFTTILAPQEVVHYLRK